MQQDGFHRSKYDNYVFIKKEQDFITILFVYMDDIVITENHEPLIITLKKCLREQIKIKDLETLK